MGTKLTDFEFTTEEPPEETKRAGRFTWQQVFELAETKPDTWLKKEHATLSTFHNVRLLARKYGRKRNATVDVRFGDEVSLNGTTPSNAETGTIWIRVKLSPVERMDSQLLK